jgi:cell wall-associated NlpC family hydrolase
MPDANAEHSWGIVPVKRHFAEVPFFWGDSLPIAPLEGRPWRMGVYDCYGLMRDWYRAKRNILLPNRPCKNERWHDPSKKPSCSIGTRKTVGWKYLMD